MNLPTSWTVTTLSSLLDQIVGGGTPSKAVSANFMGSVPFMTVKDMKARFIADTVDHISEEAVASSATTKIPPDTLVVATRMSLGKIARPSVEVAINQDLKALFPCQGIDKTYLEYFWRSKSGLIQSKGTGTTVKGIRIEDIKNLEAPLAPENEQRRIADKLDNVLTRVDTLNDRLARITSLLKRFRQSVLTTATSGRLTEDWRAETQLTAAWPLVSLGEVAKDFSYGSAAKSSKVGDIPVLRMGNIQNGSLDWQDLVYTSDEVEINKYRLCVGDVLFNRTNSPDLVGKTAVFKGEREAIYAGYLIRVKCSEKLNSDFLNCCLGSPAGRDYCWKVKSDGVSQSNINAKKLSAFEFELPSIAEQTEIVRRVEILFAYADRLEVRLQTARTAADRLTPSLLAKAFRGELVPQDPNDEPASELLRRLREARAAEAPAKKARGRKVAAA